VLQQKCRANRPYVAGTAQGRVALKHAAFAHKTPVNDPLPVLLENRRTAKIDVIPFFRLPRFLNGCLNFDG
jgi:hypothetical protein